MTPLKPDRISSIDLLRGVIMIIMALDHVRDFFYFDLSFDPTDLSKTSAALFFTRWITHFCAPVFFFLTGTSAFLVGEKLQNKKALSWWLFTRGVWMIFLEFTVIKFALFFQLDYGFTLLLVIWALGCAMIALSLLVFLPVNAILTIGLIIVIGHNALDGVVSFSSPVLTEIWRVLHVAFTQVSLGIFDALVVYPILPWIGVAAIGYAFGQLFSTSVDKGKRVRLLWRIGIGTILAFIVIRFTNLYGDPSPWAEQKNFLFTILSFINLTKYPPSLLYLCMTIGPAIVFLALSENETGWFARKAIVIGRVPFFYYVLHFYLIHSLAAVAVIAFGYHWSDMIGFFGNREKIPDYGFSLFGTYLVWASIVLALYPLCNWFNEVKKRNPEKWWLKYL